MVFQGRHFHNGICRMVAIFSDSTLSAMVPQAKASMLGLLSNCSGEQCASHSKHLWGVCLGYIRAHLERAWTWFGVLAQFRAKALILYEVCLRPCSYSQNRSLRLWLSPTALLIMVPQARVPLSDSSSVQYALCSKCHGVRSGIQRIKRCLSVLPKVWQKGPLCSSLSARNMPITLRE